MPMPNEHSCRLAEPVSGAPTRRKNGAQKHNGKAYDVIFQEQDGKWVEQAYRYPKDTWDASEARDHCKSHDGSFEAAAESKSDDSEKEIRAVIVEFRVEGAKEPKIVGYAAVFGQKSEDLGGFQEIIRPGAFRKTLKESDIRALWNHDPNYVLGRNKSGTLELKEDSTGLKMTISPPDTTWARDLMTSIKRGDIDQASFGFRTVKDEWRTEDGKQIRELVEARLFDVSVVTQPAYPQTSVAVRSKVEELNKTLAEPPEDEHSENEPAKNRHSHDAELKRIDKVILENIELEGLNGKSK